MHGKPADTDSYQVTPAPKLGDPGPFADVPAWIWKGFFGGWTAVFGLFVLFFTTDRGAAFAVTIAGLFAVFLFALTLTMAALGGGERDNPGGSIQTASGPMSEAAAAVQIALIPIAAAIGLVAFILLAK